MALTPKQKDVLDYIIEYETQHGFSPTQREIKEHFGFKSFGSVQKYLQYLGEGGLLKKEWNERRGLKVIAPQNENAATIEVPYLGEAAAGKPILSFETTEKTFSLPSSLIKAKGQFFAIGVNGDSMINAGILDNDTAIFQSTRNADDGKIVVASIDGEATIKYLKKTKGKIQLVPANDRYRPIVVDEHSGEFKILGVLVGIIRSYSPS